MADIAAVKYRAFLSYSHRDKSWAKWLHAALEGYRVDKDLVGRETHAGPVPKTLRPIFRDRDDFSAGHSLTAQTIAALEASEFLIVLCSPDAARSKYVNEEIRRFKALGRPERVIPVIVAGEPGVAERECFPPALRYRVDADGNLVGEPGEPLAADVRPQGDGKELACQKVVAALLSLRLDEIVRRAERTRKRRNRVWASLAGVMLLLAVAAGGSAVYAWQQLKTNEAFLNATLRRATEIVDEAIVQAEKFGVPRTATLAVLAKAEGLFDDMAQYGRPTADLRYRKAWMLIQFARNYALLGDVAKQLARATEAHQLLAALAAETPDSADYQRQLAVALDEVGNTLWDQGKAEAALTSYRSGLAVRDRLAANNSDNTLLLNDLSVSHSKIADVLRSLGRATEAFASQQASLAILAQLAAADPNNTSWQRDLSLAQWGIGDVLRLQGKLEDAHGSYRAALAISTRLVKADPDNTLWQRDLAVVLEKIGLVLQGQRKLDDALEAFRSSLEIAERLAAADRTNTLWQLDLSVAYGKVGNVLREQGKLNEALDKFRAGLLISERLAAADPANAKWQRGLSVVHGLIGDVLRAQGQIDEALASYEASLSIAERLAAIDQGDVQWLRGISVSHARIGDVLKAQGRLDEALARYRLNLAGAERVAAIDGSDAGWQHYLGASHVLVGTVLRMQAKPAEAVTELRKARQIFGALARVAPNIAPSAFALMNLDQEISALEWQMRAPRQ